MWSGVLTLHDNEGSCSCCCQPCRASTACFLDYSPRLLISIYSSALANFLSLSVKLCYVSRHTPPHLPSRWCKQTRRQITQLCARRLRGTQSWPCLDLFDSASPLSPSRSHTCCLHVLISLLLSASRRWMICLPGLHVSCRSCQLSSEDLPHTHTSAVEIHEGKAAVGRTSTSLIHPYIG